MSGSVYRVPPMSTLAVQQKAEAFREALALADEPLFPIMNVLEHVLDHRLELIRLEVWDDADLHGAEGLSFKDDDGVDRIVLPQSVYHAAWNHDGRARFTAAHEAGHWALHSGVALQRVQESQLRGAYESSEWQANAFAAELLMPARFISGSDTADDLCQRFGVSALAAQNRLKALRKRGSL